MKYFALLTLLFVYQSTSAQSSIIWSQTATVASSQYGNMHPRVVTDGSGDPLIIWGNNNSKQVFFSQWTGSNFSNPANLNPVTIPIFAASWAGPDLASHGDTVYVVFKETPEDASGIYIVRSFDGGANFSSPERVDSIFNSRSRFPAVSTDANGHPLVAFMKFNQSWGDAHYVLAKSTDFGSTFGPDVLGSGFSGGDVCDCCPASVVSSDNTTALLYRDNLNNLRNSWAGISFDNASSFGAGIEIDETDWMIHACPSSGPDGIIIGDGLYSVFMSAASGKTLCYRSHSTLSTLQLESLEPLTADFAGLGQQNFPRIAAYGNAAATVWRQTVNGNAQLAIQFTDNISNGFQPGHEVMANNGVANADIALSSNGKVHVVWEDMDSGTVKYKSGTYSLSGASDQANLKESVNIYPNPAKKSSLNIQIKALDEQQLTYQVFNPQGQEMQSGQGHLIEGVMKVDVSNLPNGFYFIKINLQHQNILRSVVIE